MPEIEYLPFFKEPSLNNELVPYYYGTEVCEPSHSWGPGIRDHFLMHYIVSGSGKFIVDNREYVLSEGQGFLICPEIISYYEADKANPWTYIWVGFFGAKAKELLKQAGLSLKNPIFQGDKDGQMQRCLEGMLKTEETQATRDIRFTGLLYNFIALLIENNKEGRSSGEDKNGRDYYFQRAIEFVHMNYSRNISISDIAKYIGIDRKYLHFTFKEHLGLSPQRFLIAYRMERACSLLSDDSLAISHISRSVGYSDPLLFSRIFKKIKGISPSEYRKNKSLP